VLRRIAQTVSDDMGPGSVPGALEAAAERLIGFEMQFGPFAVAQLRLLAEYAELMEDAAIRLAPITVDEARAMIAQTRIARLLAGLRGRAPGDTDALAEAIAALSQRIADPAGGASEIEINPLFVHPPGGGVTAGDCVVHAAQTTGTTGN
jgi:hypothetical protein